MVDRRQTPRQIDSPEPCFLRVRTKKGGPWYAARIVRRLGMLAAEIDGQPAPVEQVWHSGDLITAAEYELLLAATANPKPF